VDQFCFKTKAGLDEFSTEYATFEVGMMRFMFISFILCIGMHALSQPIPESDILLYKKMRQVGINLNTNGYGINTKFGRYTDATHLWIFGADLMFVKHEKETKTWNPVNDPNARPYYYGKLNNFYIARAQIGRKKIITEKLRHSGVQISYNWMVGPSFGFTKPVYLEIIYMDEPNNQPYLEVEKFDPDVHYIDNIYGRASSLRGFDELKFQPGAFGKFSFTFEYSNERERLKGIEAGIAADAFSRRIPIMAIYNDESKNPKNHQLFLSLYLNFFIGTKYDQK
jgi:hypothetical protein